MPKLIVNNGKFGVLSRRLVTDAGGAPCCCGGVCPCTPNLPLYRLQYRPCESGNKVREFLQPARLVTVAIQWSFNTETEASGGRRGFPEFRIVAKQTTYSGSGVLCYSGLSPPQVARGASAWSFIRVGNTVETIQEGGNDEGAAAFKFRGGPGLFSISNPIESHYDQLFPFNGDYGGPFLPGWSPGMCQYNEDVTERETLPGYAYDFNNVYSYTYQDSGQSGSVSGTADYTYVAQFGQRTARRETGSWSLSWQRTFSECDDGDTAPSRPGGCAGCGDASGLQIL